MGNGLSLIYQYLLDSIDAIAALIHLPVPCRCSAGDAVSPVKVGTLARLVLMMAHWATDRQRRPASNHHWEGWLRRGSRSRHVVEDCEFGDKDLAVWIAWWGCEREGVAQTTSWSRPTNKEPRPWHLEIRTKLNPTQHRSQRRARATDLPRPPMSSPAAAAMLPTWLHPLFLGRVGVPMPAIDNHAGP